MQAELQALIAFHLTGRISAGAFDAFAKSDLQPAMLAGYRDLTALRYDFPLVLVRGGGDSRCNRFPDCSTARSTISRTATRNG